MIAVLCGGVGAARFLRGARRWSSIRARSSAIVNTGDDTVLHGLAISPDLDTVTYTLAGAIDPERGWGLADETWTAMEALAALRRRPPAGSTAAPTWFNLGDRDLATHFYRTARSAEGATLTEVTAEIAGAWGVAVRAAADDRRPGRDDGRRSPTTARSVVPGVLRAAAPRVPVTAVPVRRRRRRARLPATARHAIETPTWS